MTPTGKCKCGREYSGWALTAPCPECCGLLTLRRAVDGESVCHTCHGTGYKPQTCECGEEIKRLE